MGNNATLGNGTSTNKLIAESFSFAVDPQVTTLQLWNTLLATLRSLDVVHSYRHDLYPQGFSGVVLLMDGHVAAQYAILGNRVGELNILVSTNGGPDTQELMRTKLYDAFTDILP